MKKFILILVLLLPFKSYSQGDIYPTETTFGGGIGVSVMILNLNELPGEEIITRMGLDVDKIDYGRITFFGGEGFAQMSGPWRLGGYAGFGSAQTSNVFDIYYYDETQDLDENLAGDVDSGNNLSVSARVNMMLGALTTEYVIPIYRDLEVMAGALMGIGRYSLAVDQNTGGMDDNTWASIGNDNNVKNNIYNNRYYIGVQDPDNVNGSLTRNFVSSSMTELSGTFFNFQPYIAVRWQFLDRMGCRVSAGFNRGSIDAGKWKMNGHIPVLDSPEKFIQGLVLRMTLYFGL